MICHFHIMKTPKIIRHAFASLQRREICWVLLPEGAEDPWVPTHS